MPNNSNVLLASLSPSDAAALQPHLKSIHLEQQQILVEAGDAIEAIYFPISAVISVVVALSTGELVEAAMIGRDGVVGASASLDGKISISRMIVQLAGDAVMCSLEGLRSAAMQSQSLLSLLVRHEQTLYAQAQQSAACMASHHSSVEGFVRQRSHRNFLARCWACSEPASRLLPIRCNGRGWSNTPEAKSRLPMLRACGRPPANVMKPSNRIIEACSVPSPKRFPPRRGTLCRVDDLASQGRPAHEVARFELCSLVH